jgi:hypothetical protein
MRIPIHLEGAPSKLRLGGDFRCSHRWSDGTTAGFAVTAYVNFPPVCFCAEMCATHQ